MPAGRDVWRDDFVAGQPAVAPTERTAAEDLLMIIYTSGTTGRFAQGSAPRARRPKDAQRGSHAARHLGQPPGDLSALVNPEAVEEIRQAV